MATKNLYDEAHLFIAAVRVLEHRHGTPPALEQIAELLRLSREQAGLISRRLQEAGIVKAVEGAFDDRWVVRDHLKLEALPRTSDPSQLGAELKKFQFERDKIAQKVESIKAQQDQKKKELFADIEKKLKKDRTKD